MPHKQILTARSTMYNNDVVTGSKKHKPKVCYAATIPMFACSHPTLIDTTYGEIMLCYKTVCKQSLQWFLPAPAIHKYCKLMLNVE